MKVNFFGNLELDLIKVLLHRNHDVSSIKRLSMTAGVTIIIMMDCSCLETAFFSSSVLK